MVKGAVQCALKTAEQARAPSARRTCGSVAILFSAMPVCPEHTALLHAMDGLVTAQRQVATMCRERIAVTAEQCVRFGRHFLQTLVKAEARVLTRAEQSLLHAATPNVQRATRSRPRTTHRHGHTQLWMTHASPSRHDCGIHHSGAASRVPLCADRRIDDVPCCMLRGTCHVAHVPCCMLRMTRAMLHACHVAHLPCRTRAMSHTCHVAHVPR